MMYVNDEKVIMLIRNVVSKFNLGIFVLYNHKF